MQVSRKAKLADAGGGAGGRDRLSELPDCLLHVILSRLKARQVVRTCVLSRRWQTLWLTSPCLDVDISEFLPHTALHHPSPRERPHRAAVDPVALYYAPSPLPWQHIAHEEEFYEFEDFVDCLLVHRSAGGRPPLDTVRLRIPPWWTSVQWMLCGSSSTTKYTSWVRRVLRCSPAALDVSGFVKLPPLASASTHRLTKLRLHRVMLHRDFAEHLKSGLPVLEDLEISGTELTGLSRIDSRTLRHLAVDSSSAITLNRGSLLFRIAAPRLVSLHLAVQFQHLGFFGVVVDEAPCLVRASIRLVDKPELRQRQGVIYYVQHDRALLRSLGQLLGSVSHVRTLKLSGFHDMTVAQQHIPLIRPPGVRWMQPHNFLQQHIPFIPPPPPGPGIGIYNYHRMHDPYQPAMPPLGRPMLQEILELEEEHGGLLVFDGLTTLVLDECETGHEVQTLWRFLHNAPLLENLTLKNCQFQMYPNVSGMEPLETATVPSNLKSVEIIYDDRDDDQGGGQYKVQINEASSSMIKWKLPATTMIRVTKLPKH